MDYNSGVELLEKGIEQYVGLMSVSEIELVDEAESELRNPTLNKKDLRKLCNKAQQIIFKYSKDKLDLDEIVGY